MSEQQRYQIVSRIAAGGMAEVYRGVSAGIEGFRKKVAIKRVLPKLSANQDFIEMFLDEARLGAYLSHSKCVQVFDIGQGAGSHFIVMEYVDGADLKEVLDYLQREGRVLPVEVACLIALQICEGLAYAHGACDHDGEPLRIVHRDISPHNVLMTRFGEVKLVDFGLAKASSHLADEDEDIVKGKFGYLAPEVTRGRGADHRVDIFATGILLWEMLAGRRLFCGDTDLKTFKLVQAAHVPDIREIRKDVSDDLMAVVGKALAKDPDNRYGAANDMARDLGVVLVRMQRAVTYLELAQFVHATAEDRDRKKQADARLDDDVIGDLILHELHGFSTMEDTQGPVTKGPRSIRAPGAFVDPSAWGFDDDDLGGFLEPPPLPKTSNEEPAALDLSEFASELPDEIESTPPAAVPRPPPAHAVPSGRLPAVSLRPGQRSAAAARAEQQAREHAEKRARETSVSDASLKGTWWKKWF